MKSKFLGELKYIDPSRLMKEQEEDKFANFFLVLGHIFNDLKGLLLFERLITEHYEKPEAEEVSVHSGEVGGIFMQIQKMIASTIHEFFKFLKEHKETISGREFKVLLDRMPTYARERWEEIEEVAFDRIPAASVFTNTLVRIRNNIGFHYYQSGQNLRNGFINKFFTRDKSNKNRNEFAYYSMGENMRDTRFFYCDAAAEEFFFITAGVDEVSDKSNYRAQLGAIVEDMNLAIRTLIREYLRTRPHLK